MSNPEPFENPAELEVEPVAQLRGAIEALLFVADGPLELSRIAIALGHPIAVVAEMTAVIAADLDDRQAGFELRAAGSGLRLYTRQCYAGVVEGFLLDGQRAKLSRAALETLAVLAYRQPVSRARISAIRGVNVDGVMRTLLARGLISEAGTDPDTGGGLYRTTEEFLERMGLSSIDELPSLGPLLPELDAAELAELDHGGTAAPSEPGADHAGLEPAADAGSDSTDSEQSQ